MNKYKPTKKARAAMDRTYRERMRKLGAPGSLVVLQRAADGTVLRAERVPEPAKPKLRIASEPASRQEPAATDSSTRPDPERGDVFLRALDRFRARAGW